MKLRTFIKTTRRWCSTESGERLKSGAIINKGNDSVEDVSQPKKQETPKRDMWMLKGDQDSMAAYTNESLTGGDKGYPYSSPGAMEFDDPSEPEDYGGIVERVTGMTKIPVRTAPVSAERKERQNILRNRLTSQKALERLIGPEDGMVSIIQEGSIMLVEVIGSRGRLTAGLVDQLISSCVQLHNMKSITGVIFQIRGDLHGDPIINDTISRNEVIDASSICQRASMEIQNLPFVTICVSDSKIGGMGFDMFSGCDFFFAKPETTFNFSAARNMTSGFMGSTQRLVKKTSGRKALLLLNSGEPLTSEECQRFGVVDRVTPEPLKAAKSFLSSFDESSWRNIRKFKDIIVSVEQLHGTNCFEKEQFHFRASWKSTDHIEACEHIGKSM